MWAARRARLVQPGDDATLSRYLAGRRQVMHSRPVQDKDTEMAETQTIDAPDWDLADLFMAPATPSSTAK